MHPKKIGCGGEKMHMDHIKEKRGAAEDQQGVCW